ncbi:tyrosine-protein phosphatase [Gulosibacter bifidus]|uniref:Tyrosine-protein phosphatase n=1 Tax=Gulosibacter bifidus TaxID=272239 RepID=A0ABW5RLP0_9MICO|nr:tyrosine-protein phosphatase [Gulosibacter bifidus]
MTSAERSDRSCNWPGAFNARDLGGVRIADGVIRPGVLFRSGQTQAWQPEAFSLAAAAGVKRILDFRDPREPKPLPTDDGLPERGNIEYDFQPVEDPDNAEFRARFVPYLNHPSGYPDFMALFAPRVVRAVSRVIAAGPGTLVCCSAGRDRTGLVTSLLLRGLGADIDDITYEDELAMRAISAHQLVRKTPHPYERWLPDAELAQVCADRRAALAEFLTEIDVHRVLGDHGVRAADLDYARSWLLASH